MSPNARNLSLAFGVLITIGGGTMMFLADGAGIPLVLLGFAIFASVFWEGRYGRPGSQKSIPHSDWQPTGEKFLDDETGEPVEVWIDPLTGERRYEPLGDHPRISDKRTHR